MSNTKAIESIRQKEQSSAYLSARLKINDKYQSNDFNGWLFDRLAVKKNEVILDVGCGTGKQSIPFAHLTGTGGKVCSFDISEDSIAALKAEAAEKKLTNMTAVTGRMEDIDRVVGAFPESRFDLIHSSYALYYAEDTSAVLRFFMKLLKSDGRVAVFTPVAPHGMVNFVKKYHAIPDPVEECFLFGSQVLTPFFKNNFKKIESHDFKNKLMIDSVDDFMTLYRATTYYDSNFDGVISGDIKKLIDRDGFVEFEKNGFLIIGYGGL